MESSGRREFIKKMLRWGLGGLLSVGALSLIGRSQEEDQNCIKEYPACRGCRRSRDCVQPQAMSYRKLVDGKKE